MTPPVPEAAATYAGTWLAQRVGVPALAAPLARLWQAHEEGHAAVPLARLGVDAATLAPAAPFVVVEHGHAYSRRMHTAECSLAARLRTLRDATVAAPAIDVAALFPQGSPPEQAAAVASALRSRISVITGGPGTGKTFCLQRLLAALLLEHPERRIAVVAPTGKAAARAQQALNAGLDGLAVPEAIRAKIALAASRAQTVHRLLGYHPVTGRLRHGAEDPLPADVVVLDEASMVDLVLFEALVASLGPQARLVILGDACQLASVETGVVLGDLHRAWRGTATVSELVVSRRFSDDSGIGQVAQLLRSAMDGSGDHLFPGVLAWKALLGGRRANAQARSVAGLDELLAPLLVCWRAALAARTGREARALFLDAALLTPLRGGGAWSVAGLNAAVEKQLGVAGAAYRGRPVMILVNDPVTGLVNGDIGMCWPGDDGVMTAWFDRDRRVALARLPAHETCWAMTVHKSQGSEWPLVGVALPDHDLPLMTAELLYTAVTRARERLIVRSASAVFLAAASRRSDRRSQLAERLA